MSSETKKVEVPAWMQVSRQVGERWSATVPLSRILIDGDIMAIRNTESYQDEKIRDLQVSIKTGGLMNPVHCWWDGKTDTVSVFGGTRRITAMKMMAESAPSMADEPVDAYIWVGISKAKAQLLAVTDNSFRLDFDDTERLRAIELMKGNSTADQIATAMGVEKDTIERFLKVAALPILKELLAADATGDGLPYSTLAKIGQYAEAHKEAVTETLVEWRKKAKIQRDEYLKQCEANGEQPKANMKRLSAYLKSDLLQSWITDLKAGKKPTGKVVSPKLKLETSSDKLKIRGITLNLKKATLKELADAAIVCERAFSRLKAAIEMKKAGQLAEEDDAEFRESEDYRKKLAELTGETVDTIEHIGEETDGPTGKAEESGEEI